MEKQSKVEPQVGISMIPIVPIISGLVAAWPEISKIAGSLWSWIVHVSNGDPEGYIKTLAEAMDKLDKSQSVHEREQAAKAIADAIRGLK